MQRFFRRGRGADQDTDRAVIWRTAPDEADGGAKPETAATPGQTDPADLLFIPVLAGYWKQHELWDGTYTLDDLADILRAIARSRGDDEHSDT